MVIKNTIITYGSKYSTKDLIRLLYIKTKNIKSYLSKYERKNIS